jgi:hypothetical protein
MNRFMLALVMLTAPALMVLNCSGGVDAGEPFKLGAPYKRTISPLGVNELQIAVKTYTHQDPQRPRIRLLGVMHIAEGSYYEEVQKILDGSSRVFYEDVAVGEEDMSFFLNELGFGVFFDILQCQKLLSILDYSKFATALDMRQQSNSLVYNSQTSTVVDTTTSALLRQFLEVKIVQDTINRHNFDNHYLCSKIISVVTQLAIDHGEIKGVTATQTLAMSADEFQDFVSTMVQIKTRADLARSLLKSGGREASSLPFLDDIILTKRNDLVIQKIGQSRGYVETITVIYGAAHMPGIENGLAKLGYEPEKERWLTAFKY